MEQILSSEAVMAAAVTILVALAAVLVSVIRTLGRAAVRWIEQQAGLAHEERRRRAAEDVVAMVEQMWPDLTGAAKLSKALARAGELDVDVDREDIEGALKRLTPWAEEMVRGLASNDSPTP